MRTRAALATCLTAWLTASLALAAPPADAEGRFAPLDRPGPALSVPRAALDASLRCVGDLATGPHEPVLLVPGTGVDPQEFSWNWMRSLQARGWSFCAVTLPEHSTGDIQIAGEYVVHAVRTMHARSAGRKVQIVGHSQGGMLSRWSLRFWPDLRPMVDDLAGMAPSQHGTVVAAPTCVPDCSPSVWQQRDVSAFNQALNSGAETFAGISYTNVYTHTDEIVVPNADDTGSSSLHTGAGRITNVAIQDVCPDDLTEHLGIGTYDNTAYQLILDALTHPGPAVPSRVPVTACTPLLQPGVNPATFAPDYAGTLALLASNLAAVPHTTKEPTLACYTQLVCAQTAPRSPAVLQPVAATRDAVPPAAAPRTTPALAATGPGRLPWLAAALLTVGVACRRISREGRFSTSPRPATPVTAPPSI